MKSETGKSVNFAHAGKIRSGSSGNFGRNSGNIRHDEPLEVFIVCLPNTAPHDIFKMFLGAAVKTDIKPSMGGLSSIGLSAA